MNKDTLIDFFFNKLDDIEKEFYGRDGMLFEINTCQDLLILDSFVSNAKRGQTKYQLSESILNKYVYNQVPSLEDKLKVVENMITNRDLWHLGYSKHLPIEVQNLFNLNKEFGKQGLITWLS